MSATSRSVYRDTITVTRRPDGVLLPAVGAEVRFYEPDGGALTPLSVPLYGSPDSTTPLTLPVLTSPLGEVEVWSDEAGGLRARQVVQFRDRPVSDEVVDFEPPPGTYATQAYVDGVMDFHEGDQSAHAQYLTEPEGNLLYLPLSHQPGVDPHPQYLQAAVFNQPDPLGQYQLETEKAQPGGYAPLDPNGLLPTAHLPPLAITNTFVVANEAEQLALDAQVGDLAIRTDSGKSYILAAEPASSFPNWKELSASAPVLSVDGRVGVVDLSDRYLSLGGGTVAGNVGVTGNVTASGNVECAYLGTGSAQVYGGGALLLWNIGNSDALGWQYGPSSDLLLVHGGAPTPFRIDTGGNVFANDAMFNNYVYVQGLPVAVSPAAGNIMQWLPDGLFAGLSTANVTVMRREEFTPAVSATSVTLAAAPSTVLEVSRNGVAQSAALGHYTVAGTVVTFVDSFAVGEQVLVLYEIGVSQPVDSYSKGEADARYEPIDTMYTKGESDARYSAAAHLHTGTYLPLTGGTLTGALVMSGAGVGVSHAAGSPAFAAGVTGDTFTRTQLSAGGVFSFGPGSAALDTTLQRTAAGRLQMESATATAPVGLTFKFGSGTARARVGQIAADGVWISANAGYDGTSWHRDDTTKGAMQLSMSPTEATFYTTAPGANPVSAWTAGAMFRADGAINATKGLIISGNAPSSGYGIDVSGDIMVRGPGSLYVSNTAFTASAGWRYSDAVNGLAHVQNGTPTGSLFGSSGDLYVRGAINIQPGVENIAGEWLTNNSAGGFARQAFVGLEGDYRTWRVYNQVGSAGNKLTLNLDTGYVTIPGALGVTGQITTSTGLAGNGAVLAISSTANIQLAPAGSYIHPSADNTVNLGHPGINWAAVCTHSVVAPGQLSFNTGAHLVATCGGGGWIYLRSTGHTFFQGSPGAIVAPENDNRLICGGTGNRWQYVAAVNGSINTCWAHEKAIIGTVDPRAALEALLATPLVLYHPKDCEGTVDERLTFAGPVNTSVDPRLQIGEGALTAAGHQVAYAMAAIQALAAEVADLKARLA
jgi:hypothetical protein